MGTMANGMQSAVRSALRARQPAHMLTRHAHTAPAPASASSQTSRAGKLMRRFWKTVSVQQHPQGGIAVMLDKRTLKTPQGTQLALSQINRWGEVEDTHDVDNQDVRVRLGSASMLARFAE